MQRPKVHPSRFVQIRCHVKSGTTCCCTQGMHSCCDLMQWLGLGDSPSFANYCSFGKRHLHWDWGPLPLKKLPQKQQCQRRLHDIENKHLDIVKLSDLGEEPHVGLCVLVVPELDGLGPVVAPLHHSSRLQMI